MFALGAGVTLATLSVAVSLTLLVPMALRGTIRRDAIVPYVLGANITTFVDTLFAAAALERGGAAVIVVTTMIFATLVALFVLAVRLPPLCPRHPCGGAPHRPRPNQPRRLHRRHRRAAARTDPDLNAPPASRPSAPHSHSAGNSCVYPQTRIPFRG